jgi:hypothetical protein
MTVIIYYFLTVYRYDWYQTQTHVVVNILIKNVGKDNCHVDLEEKSVNASQWYSLVFNFDFGTLCVHR